MFAADRPQSALSGGFSSIPALLCELFALLGGLLIYAELVVRDALVLVTVALAPLSFAAMVWPTARGAARRVGELLAAIVLSKLAIWVALLVGIDLFQNQAFSPGPDAWGQMIAGSAVLAVAVFAPFVVWRLLPVAPAVIAQGLSRQPGRAVQNSMYVANSARNMAGHLGRSGGGGGHPSQPSSPSPLPSRSLAAPAANGPAGAGSSGPAAPAGPAGAAAGGGGADAGRAAAAGSPAAVVAVPVAEASAAKDKATSAATASRHRARRLVGVSRGDRNPALSAVGPHRRHRPVRPIPDRTFATPILRSAYHHGEGPSRLPTVLVWHSPCT